MNCSCYSLQSDWICNCTSDSANLLETIRELKLLSPLQTFTCPNFSLKTFHTIFLSNDLIKMYKKTWWHQNIQYQSEGQSHYKLEAVILGRMGSLLGWGDVRCKIHIWWAECHQSSESVLFLTTSYTQQTGYPRVSGVLLI